MPRKAKRNALKSALAMKYADKQIMVLDSLKFKEPKTKDGAEFLKKLKLDSVLVIDHSENKNVFLSLRNIPKVKAVDASQINIYDVLNHKSLVFTQKAFESVMERLK
jgi:large subunit ribosomal protein L4